MPRVREQPLYAHALTVLEAPPTRVDRASIARFGRGESLTVDAPAVLRAAAR
ncbi:hypothetical protein [Streptomyces sp. NPDC102282]|uniref:hypothetical protein n=1 Tax=Streptomyces sp. NPDC102282 TaxID=3366154 RepID=UPI0037F775C5